jgi:tagatose-6-phosphate ketose/aldose isomerase
MQGKSLLDPHCSVLHLCENNGLLYLLILSLCAPNRGISKVNSLSELLALPDDEKHRLGLIHTPSEIAQQPASWQITNRLFEDSRSELRSFLRQAHDERWTIYMVGAGSSDYIGHSLANLLRRHWKCEVAAVPSTDLLANRDDLVLADRNYLWISFSRSGDSPEGIAVLEQALAFNPKVRHLVVSCNRNGRMVKLAQENNNSFAMVLDDAVNDRSLAMTSSFTNMIVFGQALAHLWEKDHFEKTLSSMTLAAEYILAQGADLASGLAKQNYHRACFVGAGGLGATARESALKLLELTSGRIQTMYETTLGLRHGPMSSLNIETLFTAFLSTDDRRRRYDNDLVNEVRAKQVVRTIVAVGRTDAAGDYNLHCPAFDHIEDAYRPAVDIIFSQMLGLFSSIELGMKPDSPSPSGLINRVVEKFAIYA